MIVKCIERFGKNLPSDCLTAELRYSERDKNVEFDLVIGKFYVVYAMALFGKYLWYAVCEASMEFPIFRPAPFFLIENSKLSKYWIYSYIEQQLSYLSNANFGFPEWINEDYFYNKLLNDGEREIKIFSEYKTKMDLEFRDPLIIDSAEEIDAEWLLCPFCIDAWQELTKFEMVICPKCCKKMLNPHIKSVL